MKVWTIRIKKKQGGNWDEPFVPSRGRSLRAFQKRLGAKPVPSVARSWTLEALFGLYIEQYEMRFRRKWPFTAERSGEDVVNLRCLVQRVGMVEAVSAVYAVFGMKWITGQHSAFLAHKDNYATYVIPELEKRQAAAGEQAEYEGDRSEQPESRSVTSKEFFS